MMEYKGYVGTVEFDPVAEVFRGEIANLCDVLAFQGRSVEELKQALASTVEDYLAFCRDRGEKPDRPYSGRLLLRMEPQTHRAVASAAAREGKSLNAWTVEVLERAAGAATRPRTTPGASGAGAPALPALPAAPAPPAEVAPLRG